MGKTVLDKDLFCPICSKITKNRHTLEESDEVYSFNEKGEVDDFSKQRLKNHSEKINEIFSNPQIKWVCLSCKSKGRKTLNYGENPFMTMMARFSKDNLPKTEEEKQNALIESLARAISHLEDRIVSLEKMPPVNLFIKPRRRIINIIDSDKK